MFLSHPLDSPADYKIKQWLAALTIVVLWLMFHTWMTGSRLFLTDEMLVDSQHRIWENLYTK